MNVLFTIRGETPYTSLQAQIELMLGIQKQGASVFIIGLVLPEVEAKIREIGLSFSRLHPKKGIDKSYITALKEIVDKEKIDLIYCWDTAPLRNAIIAFKKHPVKLVVYYGSLSLHWHDPSAYLTVLNKRVDRIICNSQHVFDHVKKQLIGKQKQKVRKVYKGYNPDWFKDDPVFDYTALKIPKSAIVVCLIGNHRKVKGIQYFLKSSYHLTSKREIHYVIIGDNTDDKELYALASKSPIANRIHLLGRRSDVISLLKGCDIYTQTSIKEGFGRAVSEALCVGKPIVMTNSGGGTELIDNSCGIVTPIKNPKAIAQAISTLSDDDKLRKSMSENAKKRIEETFHVSKTIENTFLIYQELLN